MFLAQICFAESLEVLHVRKLPGDVMLIFCPNPDGIWDSDEEEPESLHIEWWPLGLKDLPGPSDLPQQKWIATKGGGLAPAYAELHRTNDFPEVPEDHPIRQIEGFERLCRFEGGKLGGRPYLTQDDPPCRGDFLCCLGSLSTTDAKWPFVNLEQNPAGDSEPSDNLLSFGDMGTLYFGASRGGLFRKPRVHWGVQGY
jgi:hypothetical protein